MFDLIVENAKLYPMAGSARPDRPQAMAVKEGRIAGLGKDASEFPEGARTILDARGQLLLPGLVDCHTHAVFAGDRSDEHGMRLAGKSYAEISAAGGGIASTVTAVRQASEEQLMEQSLPRIRALMDEGVTSLEIKSGYGLDPGNEIKMLRAIRRLRDALPLDICATFLGAHAVPAGAAKDGYLNQVIEEMLPQIAEEQLADTVDIYVETIAFDRHDLERLALAARAQGLRFRAHTDQISNQGGTRHAARLGALSCDHLEFSEDRDIEEMAIHGTVAVLLPGAYYFLRETQKPPVAALRAAGVPMAVATDLNPGTSPVASLLTCLHFATTLFGLSRDEALLGVTSIAARALGRGTEIGSLETGKLANFCLWDLPDPGYLTYQLGGLRPSAVYYRGLPR